MTLPSGLANCFIAAQSADLSVCKPLGFSLIEWIAVISFGAATLAGLWKLAKAVWLRVQIPKHALKVRSFRQLRKSIAPLMMDNSRIFTEFGPNSGANAADEEMRFDLSVWQRLRPQIVENNVKIAALIQANLDVIPQNFDCSFKAWLSHIDAFRAHVEDASVDYRAHRFPNEIPNIIAGR